MVLQIWTLVMFPTGLAVESILHVQCGRTVVVDATTDQVTFRGFLLGIFVGGTSSTAARIGNLRTTTGTHFGQRHVKIDSVCLKGPSILVKKEKRQGQGFSDVDLGESS
jgi:hypothetical protein